ncbi:thioesterase family protein [Williamsia sp. CHRR-6]|uniref:acyl-CoA thioesterase n=1 Tax=Williamsia sp. CHRR-6 TaxID=2835871 RepID=UPI001BDAE318|nr:thioesterase family protein [Williamsia sp. CHRR-6]MBT0568505.1 thioesterase family protein [Williamsia sp. CHRR-6]
MRSQFRRPRSSFGHSLVARFRVGLSDLDMLRHMTNGRYLSILDAARIDYMARTGLWRHLRRRRWHPVVVAQTISYRRPLTLGVRYEVVTTPLGFDTRNVYYQQTFRVEATVHAHAVVAVRILDSRGSSVTPDLIRALPVTFSVPSTLPPWVVSWVASMHTAADTTTNAGADTTIDSHLGGSS